jgi:hypothetical protein
MMMNGLTTLILLAVIGGVIDDKISHMEVDNANTPKRESFL